MHTGRVPIIIIVPKVQARKRLHKTMRAREKSYRPHPAMPSNPRACAAVCVIKVDAPSSSDQQQAEPTTTTTTGYLINGTGLHPKLPYWCVLCGSIALTDCTDSQIIEGSTEAMFLSPTGPVSVGLEWNAGGGCYGLLRHLGAEFGLWAVKKQVASGAGLSRDGPSVGLKR